MKVIRRQQIQLRSIHPHPSARESRNDCADWQTFAKSIARDGITEDMDVRELPNGAFQCIQGHRRLLAGKMRKIKTAWCRVIDATDAEALETLWSGNQHREKLSVTDEIRGIQELVTLGGLTLKQVARKWNRPLAWVRLRHQIPTLGPEVMEAVTRPGRDGLTLEAVAEILKVPVDLRLMAVQMALHPNFQIEPLDADQARDTFQHFLLKAKAKAAAWESLRIKTESSERKRLRKLCREGTTSDLKVEFVSVSDAASLIHQVEADTLVGDELPGAPDGLLWLHVAVYHGEPVKIVPGADGSGVRAIVNRKRLMDAEAASNEAGGHPWPKARRQRADVSSTAPAEEHRGRRGSPPSWQWVPDSSMESTGIPSIRLGRWGAQDVVVRPREDGQCEWVGIGDAKAVQRDWLKAIRREVGWEWIRTVANVSVRHWEGWEQGRPLPFAKAAWINHRAHTRNSAG